MENSTKKSNENLTENLLQKEDTLNSEFGENNNIYLEKDSCLRKAFFLQTEKIIEAGIKKPYTKNMLFKLKDNMLYKEYNKFEKYYEENKRKFRNNLLKISMRYHRGYIVLIDFLNFVRIMLDIVFPVILKELLIWIESENIEEEKWKGYVYAGIIGVSIFVKSYTGLLKGYYTEVLNNRIFNVFRVIFFKILFSFILNKS